MPSLDDRPAPKNKATVYKESGIHSGQSQGSNDGTFGNDKNNNREFDEAKIRGGSIYELNKTNKAERDHFKRYGQTISQSREVQQQREIEKTKKEQKEVKAIKDIVDKQIEAHFNLNPLPSPPKQIVPVPPKANTPIVVPLIPPNNQGFGLAQSPYVMRTTQYGMSVPLNISPVAAIAENLDNPDTWERIKAGFANRNLAGATVYGVVIPIIVREYTIQNSGASSGTFSKKTFGRNLTFDSIGMLKTVGVEYLISDDLASGTHTGGL